MDTIKKLSRKKVRGLGELLDMPEADRLSVLQDIGQSFISACTCSQWQIFKSLPAHYESELCKRMLLHSLLKYTATDTSDCPLDSRS